MVLESGRRLTPLGLVVVMFASAFLAEAQTLTACAVPSFDWGSSSPFWVGCYGSLQCRGSYDRASQVFPFGRPGHPSPDFLTVGAVNVDYLRFRPDGSYFVETGDGLGGYQAIVDDFNHDGIPDLLVYSFGKIVVRLGNGNRLGPGAELPLSSDFFLSGIFLVTSGDFDGDGTVDLLFVRMPLLAPRDPIFTILKGLGDGSFVQGPSSRPLSLDPVSSSLNLGSIVPIDLDGDGRLDLVLLTHDSPYSSAGPGPTIFLRNAGDGTFSRMAVWEAGQGQDQLVSAAVVRRTGAVSPDLVAIAPTTAGCMLLSIPAGTIPSLSQPPARRRIGPVPCDGSTLVVADLNGDGVPDVATLQQGDLVVVTGDGRGGLADVARLAAGSFTVLAAANAEGPGPANLVALSANRGPGDGMIQVPTEVVSLRNACSGPGSSATAVLPWIGAVAGLSSALFESDLTLSNSGATTAVLDLRYSSTTGEGSGTVHHTLAPGEQLHSSSALDFLRSKGLSIPEAGNEGGSLRVAFSGLSNPAAGFVVSRTASRGAGVAYPGSVPQGAPLLVGPLKEDASDRTNLVISHTGGPGSSDAVLRVTILSTDSPSSIDLPDIVLKPGEVRQLNRVLSSGGLAATSGWAKVALNGAAAPFSAHAIVNDNVTSDGSWIPATVTHPGTLALVVPAVVEASGYSTELFLVNTTFETLRIRLEIPISPLEIGAPATLVIDLPAQGEKVIPDLFEELRRQGIGPGKGPPIARHLVVRREDGGSLAGVIAGARVQNAATGGGRYGVYLPAVDVGELPTTSAVVAGIRQDETTRTNLAISNLGDGSSSAGVFRVALYDGASGTQVASLEGLFLVPGDFLQLDSVLARAAPGTTNGWARVTRTAGNGPFVVYAVVNDGSRPGEGTGDGSFLLGRPEQ